VIEKLATENREYVAVKLLFSSTSNLLLFHACLIVLRMTELFIQLGNIHITIFNLKRNLLQRKLASKLLVEVQITTHYPPKYHCYHQSLKSCLQKNFQFDCSHPDTSSFLVTCFILMTHMFDLVVIL